MSGAARLRHAPIAFGVNTGGRDLVVGDVHGSFRTLAFALDVVGFDAGCDRLFGVGDLVTRLPANAFGYVPTPAIVAPIEFTLPVADYEALRGHLD